MPRNIVSKNGRKGLSARQAAIIRCVVKCAPEPVTLNRIAGELEVSTRTILRELDSVEAWLEENDFHFVRKPGVGLAIQEDGESLRLISELLSVENVQPSFSRKERRRQILGELLCAKEPVKSYVFRSRFQISEGTLSTDLDDLDKWLASYQIRLVRRPGVGIFLEGSETAYRQAIANAAFEFSDEGSLLKLLRGETAQESAPQSAIQERLFRYIDPQIVSFVEKILSDTAEQLDIQYTDSGYMALVVHLSLALRRLLSGEKIEMNPEDLEELSRLEEFPVAQKIAGRIGEQFQVKIPKEEVGFITMHLSTARVWPQSRRQRSQMQSINTRQVVMEIVSRVEKELGLPFHTCTRMIEELMSHMDSMISRLSMNIQLENTQVEAIQKNYPDIYAAVEKGCGVFKSLLQIKDVSPSEITFVAMHFVAAAETLRVEQKRVAVAVVCPSGMGASRMLAANLMRTFHNIEIRQIVSAFSIEPEGLRKSGIDLVISTVPLQIEFPTICVSPIPQAQDILLITQTVEDIANSREKKLPLPETQVEPPPMNLSQIVALTHMGEEVLHILNHFTLLRLVNIHRVEDLLGEAAGLFADSLLTRRIIGNDLARREAIHSTFLPEMHIHLLHCRTAAIEHCRFGYLRLEQPIQTPEGSLEGAVILLAPESGGRECIEVISRLSMLLAEEKSFLQALQAGDLTGGKALAEQALVKYYQNELKRIGDGKL